MTLIAEDLLVVLIHDRGSMAGRLVRPEVPIGAAVLAELALAGVVERTAFTLRLGRAVHVVGETPPDPVLVSAVELLERKPLQPHSAAELIGREVLEALATRLEAAGVLTRTERRGRRGRTRVEWTVTDPGRRAAVLEAVRRVLDPALPVDPRAAVIAGVLVELRRLKSLLGLRVREAGSALMRMKKVAQPRWAIDTVAFDEAS